MVGYLAQKPFKFDDDDDDDDDDESKVTSIGRDGNW